jgi:hypothetical protein
MPIDVKDEDELYQLLMSPFAIVFAQALDAGGWMIVSQSDPSLRWPMNAMPADCPSWAECPPLTVIDGEADPATH